MDNRYDALDWQSFSQKKDIEEIVKNTKDKNDIQLTAVIEIAMSVSSIVSDNLFSGTLLCVINIITYIVSIIPLIWIGFKYLKRWYNKNKPGADIPNASAMIDLFDNEICYYALMAESYISKSKNINTSNPSPVEQFYFIEACFYINKTIYNLSLTSNCIELYSINYEELYQNRNISYTRLKNIFNILDFCMKEIEESDFYTINNIDINSNYATLYKEYKNEYNRFKKLFKFIEPSI